MTAMAETSRGDWWLAKLGEGTREEFDYAPEIEGRLPAGLSRHALSQRSGAL